MFRAVSAPALAAAAVFGLAGVGRAQFVPEAPAPPPVVDLPPPATD
jgi:hypothetical protein